MDITIDILGYAVDSLYPTIEINNTIREVINIKLVYLNNNNYSNINNTNNYINNL